MHYPQKTILIRAVLVTALLFTLFSNSPARATVSIYRVTPGGVNTGSCGATWTNSCDLSYAINLSNPGDQLWVAAGTYKPTTNNDRTKSFILKNGVALYGGFAGSETEFSQRDIETNVTILSGDIGVSGNLDDNSYHVVYSNQTDSSSILDGFTITNGNANGTYPYSRGGGIFNYKGSPALNNLVINQNSTTDLGGGVYNFEGSPEFSAIEFRNNYSENRGGGIFNYTSQVTMSNVIFDGNYAKDLGGGMNSYSSQSSITTATFTNNTSGTSGGGLYSFGGSISVNDATFTGNSARDGAGMYNTWYSVATLTDITFQNNSATERAGGFYNYLSDAKLTQIVFLDNSAGQHGGGMFTGDSDPVLEDVQFSNNSCDMNGGGLNNNASSPTLTNVTFLENQADNGGGIYNWDMSSPVLENVVFQGNTASSRGGGMYGVTSSNFVLNNVNFTGNSAQGYGGAIFSDSSTPTLNYVSFNGNTSQQRGGALYLSGSPSTLADVTFSGNTSYDGGGLFTSASDSILTRVTFSDNSSLNRGGGLYNYLSELTLSNITFINNYTKTYGGAYFNADGGFQLTNGTFTANRADVYGGAIASDESSAKIVNSILWDNTAGSNGNQVYLFSGGVPIIKNSVIESGCPAGADCRNILTSDPKLGEFGDHGGFTQTISILEGSSAVDAGDDESSPPTDQRGVDRPQGSASDIGAYESEFENTVEIPHSPADDEKLTTSKVIFEWGEMTGATLYKIRLSTDPDFNTLILKTKTANTNYAYDEFLTNNTTYYWQIRPIYGAEKGSWSPVFWFQSMDTLEPPALLSPFHKESTIETDITFSWSGVENGVTYKILIATDPGFTNKVFKTKTGELTLLHTLEVGKYYWRVRAFDASGGRGPWSAPQILKIIP